MNKPRLLIKNANIFTADPANPLLVEHWIASDVNRSTWEQIGEGDPPHELAAESSVFDAEGNLVTPPLVDCHTHLVYGGNRAAEFEQRLEGASYEEILQQGGGIHSTVKMTADASDDELIEGAMKRAELLRRQGVSLIEVKTGYGLTIDAERRLLHVLREFEDSLKRHCANTPEQLPVAIRRTLLLHTVPVSRRVEREKFVNELCQQLIPEAASEGLAHAVDVFCETGAFTLEEAELILEAGKQNGLALKIHAEQITPTGSAAMAARLGARSCDHLEMLDPEGIEEMARSGSVAVLLPGAQLFLHAFPPPVSAMREAGVAMAVATDCNPGSSNTTNLHLMMSLACLNMELTPMEALLGVTSIAERALDGDEADAHKIRIEGPSGPLLRWPVEKPAELVYHLGHHFEPEVILPERIGKP